MSRRRPAGIWPHLLLTAAVGIVVVGGIIGYGSHRQQRAFYLAEIRRDLRTQGQNVVGYLDMVYVLQGAQALPQALTHVSVPPGGRVIVSNGSQIVADTDTKAGSSVRCSHGDLSFSYPMPGARGPTGTPSLTAVFCVPDPTLGPALRVADAQFVVHALLLPGIIGLLAALAASLLLGRRIALPLVRLAGTARRFAEGDLTARAVESGPGEVADLAGEFNRMAAGLEEAQRQRQAMVADVAHELRTPLTVMRGYLEALKDGVTAPTQETLDVVHAEALQLQGLVDDLQDLAQAEAAELVLTPEALQIEPLLQTIATGFALQAQQQDVRLDVEAASDLPAVTADPRRIGQVVHNLIANALRYTPAGGVIRLTATLGLGEVRVEVADTGIGIPPEHLPHVFDRFYRVDPSRARETGGAGLGLTIARRIIQAHGGEMGATSRVGSGSHFWFTLPVHSAVA